MSHKTIISLKTLSSYRRPLEVFVLLCLSTSAQSEGFKENFIYIDCSITANEVSDPSHTFKTNNSYRLDSKNKKFTYYSETRNDYLELCASSCVITDDAIVWKSHTNVDNMDITFNYNINRWTGKFEGSSTQFQSGKLKYELKHYGECKSGVSKLKTTPKF
jgi:hypothetical protein